MTLAETLADLVKEERKLAEEAKDLDTRVRALRAIIREELDRERVEKVETAGWSVAVVRPKPSSTLDVGKLVAAGVTPDQLEKGTVVKERASYVSIRPAAVAA